MDKLRSVELYRDEHRRIMAIESVELSQRQFNNGGHVYATLAPVAIIVCTSAGNEVLLVNKDETRSEQLKDLISELE